jgi:hypothetical protein
MQEVSAKNQRIFWCQYGMNPSRWYKQGVPLLHHQSITGINLNHKCTNYITKSKARNYNDVPYRRKILRGDLVSTSTVSRDPSFLE